MAMDEFKETVHAIEKYQGRDGGTKRDNSVDSQEDKSNIIPSYLL